jgi:hypothetical protein
MVFAPTGSSVATVVTVEPAIDVVVGGVDPEQPTTASMIVANTKGAGRLCRTATTRSRRTGPLPSTASASNALSRGGGLCTES